ncbi:MAG: acyltransferase [Eubacteriales bacterium]|nr:acyltransferase [Eubacteriales bacterium]
MRFETLFRYRKQCMTAAIVLILLNHMKAAWPESPAKIAASFFYGGVDLFFFLSGVGCFFSWRRDRDPAAFLRRRALRILPSYLPLILVWLALQAAEGGIAPNAALANLLGVHGFMKLEPSFNWYVSGMWLSYLLTPWLAALAERCDTKPRMAAGLAGLLMLSAAFWYDYELVIMLTRLPVFFAGMLFAAESERRDALTRTETALLLALVPVGALLLWEFAKYLPDRLWDLGLHWYPFLLIAPGACLAVAGTASALARCRAGRALNRAAGFIGGYTFEIYLTHLCLPRLPAPLFLLSTALCTALLAAVSKLLRRGLEKRRTAGAAL